MELGFEIKLGKRRYSKRIKSALVSAGWRLGLSVVIFLVLFLPNFRRVLGVRDLISELKTEQSLLEDRLSSVENLQSKYSSYEEMLISFDQALPQDPAMVGMTGQIALLGRQSGLSLGDLNVRCPTVGSVRSQQQSAGFPRDISWYDFTIRGRGQYSQIRDFILSLEEDAREILIADLSISHEESESSLTFTMSGQIFSQ